MILVRLAASMGTILATWVILSAVMVGVGLAVRRAFGSLRIDGDSLWQDFWMGLAVCLLLLQVWHFLLPINWLPLAILSLVGTVSLFSARRPVSRALGESSVRNKVAFGLTFVFWLWLSNRAMSPSLLYDTGMYHMPVVEWSKAYAIVPGLGNLHGRLAFNNSSLLFGAMLDVGLWSGRAEHIAGGLLIFALAPGLVVAASRLACRKARARDGFDFILLAAVVHLVLRRQFVSFSPDLAVTATLFAAASMLYAWLTDRTGDAESRSYALVLVTALLATAVSMKVTILGFAGTAVIVAIVAWWREPHVVAQRRRTALWAGGLSVAIATVWLARGVLLSGFPAYPSTLFGADVDWRVPDVQAEGERAWTHEWGRTVSLDHEGKDTAVQWAGWLGANFQMGFRGLLWNVALPVLLAITFLPFAMMRNVEAGARRARRKGWLLLVPTAAGIGFWLATTAVIRHGQPVAWILAATVAGQFVVASGLPSRSYRQTILFAAGLILALSAVVQFAVRLTVLDRVAWWATAGGLLTRPGDDLGVHRGPVPAIVQYTTDSGLILAVPVKNNVCWRIPLPCTPHPAPNLRLRVPGELSAGFATDGEWLQEWWPNPKTDFRERFLKDREARER